MEFGAGRGKLSHWIHRALKNPEPCPDQNTAKDPESCEDLQLLLVERSSTRFKVKLQKICFFRDQALRHQDQLRHFQRFHVQGLSGFSYPVLKLLTPDRPFKPLEPWLGYRADGLILN